VNYGLRNVNGRLQLAPLEHSFRSFSHFSSIDGPAKMDNSRDYQLRQTADALYQLAELVERSGLDAGFIGRMLADASQRVSLDLSVESRGELFELQSSQATAAQFAAGLRPQADVLEAQACPAGPTR
jgi:hypothetical protein